jgi:hypothetical protein
VLSVYCPTTWPLSLIPLAEVPDAGDIDRGEAAAAIEETGLVPGAVGGIPYDLAAIVDPVGWVRDAPGTSIMVKPPAIKMKPAWFPVLSTVSPAIWPLLLIPLG